MLSLLCCANFNLIEIRYYKLKNYISGAFAILEAKTKTKCANLLFDPLESNLMIIPHSHIFFYVIVDVIQNINMIVVAID